MLTSVPIKVQNMFLDYIHIREHKIVQVMNSSLKLNTLK